MRPDPPAATAVAGLYRDLAPSVVSMEHEQAGRLAVDEERRRRKTKKKTDMARKFSELRSKMSPEARARVDARVIAALDQLPLLELRRARHLSQEKLAQALETTQGEISKIEHRTDLYLSTLRNYIEAMGENSTSSPGSRTAPSVFRRSKISTNAGHTRRSTRCLILVGDSP
jgi:DNA-binding transcriptional regulator YiaG